MQLTRYSDYSLRLLIYLALRPEERVTIEEVAAAYGISRTHLMKVAHELGQAGFIRTLRGRGGGLQLLRRADSLTVGEVVRRTEDRMDLVECFDPDTSACQIEPACALKGVLDEALAAFQATLDRYTLADLIARRRQPLLRLLDPPG